MNHSPRLERWVTFGLRAAFCAGILSFSLSAAAPQAQTPAENAPRNTKKEKEKPWRPMVVSANVLRFGAQLEDAASPALKDWLRAHVNQQLREKPIDPKVTIDAVDARFPAASDRARDAGIYLAYVLASRDDTENERVISFRIREIEREADDISHQLAAIWREQQRRLASASSSSPSAAESVRQQDDEQKLNTRLRELSEERELKMTQAAFTRKKVNIYLKLMAMAYEKMKGTDPAILGELK